MTRGKDGKAQTHERILNNAAVRFREKGIDGIGVADLMKEAGLTVGGFYKHFGSREDLVAEAVEAMKNGWDPVFADAETRGLGGAPLFDALVDGYLDVQHRDSPGAGCLFAAIAGDLGRAGEKPRAAATHKLERMIDRFARVFEDRRPAAARAAAIFAYSALVGAVSLARATNDEALSREILTTVGKALKRLVRPEKT